MRQFKDPIAQAIYERAYRYVHDEEKFPEFDDLADIMAQWIVQPLSGLKLEHIREEARRSGHAC